MEARREQENIKKIATERYEGTGLTKKGKKKVTKNVKMYGAATMNLGGRSGTKFGPCFGTEPPVVRKKKYDYDVSKMSRRRGPISFFDAHKSDRSAFTNLPNYNSADEADKYNSASPQRRDPNP